MLSVSTIVSNLPNAQKSHQLSFHPLSTSLHTSSIWQPRYCQSACLPSHRTCLRSLRWRQRTAKCTSIPMPRQMNGNWHTVYRPLVSAEPHVPPKLSAPTESVSKQDWYHTSNTNAKSLDDTTSIRCLSSAIRLYGSATVSPEIWPWPSLWLTLYLLRISSALFSARCGRSYGLNSGLKRHVSIIFGIMYNLLRYHDQPKAKSARSRHAAFRSRYGLNKNSEKGSKITLRRTKMSSKLRNLVSNHSPPFGHTYVYLAAPSAVYTLLVYKSQTSYLTTISPVALPLPSSWFLLESDSSYRPFQAFFLTHSFLAWVRTQPHSFWISISTCLFG